jgi:hypothetical protein
MKPITSGSVALASPRRNSPLPSLRIKQEAEQPVHKDQWAYLYHAIGKNGETIDFMLPPRRTGQFSSAPPGLSEILCAGPG